MSWNTGRSLQNANGFITRRFFGGKGSKSSYLRSIDTDQARITVWVDLHNPSTFEPRGERWNVYITARSLDGKRDLAQECKALHPAGFTTHQAAEAWAVENLDILKNQPQAGQAAGQKDGVL